MRTRRLREAFTLIEVLIVVVIMAVLAATIIPQFTEATGDAKDSSLTFNMRTMRSQIELYRMQHNSVYPTLTNTNYILQLTAFTDVGGATSTTPGTANPFGPYMDEIPANPFIADATKSNVFVAVGVAGVKPTGVVGSGEGWQYDETTGDVWPNNTEYYAAP